MVRADLTREMIEAGRQLLERLDRARFRAHACFWLYLADSERWNLVIASPEVRARGPLAAYRRIESVARKLPQEARIFAPGDVTAVKDTDPMVALMRSRFPGKSVDGTFIDDAYVYRIA